VKLTVLHSGIGAVTDSDVHLADASNAIIIAYRVTAPGKTRRLAEEHGVDIRSYKVIYDVTDDIKKALEGLLTPDEVVEPRGTAEVREVFRITKVGLVAGSYVREGVIGSNHLARVTREGSIIRDNCKFDSLKRFKDDAKEVRSGMECGIRLEGFDDLKVGDIIESFEIVKVARTFDG
jgi:translation initiation factor IF-2